MKILQIQILNFILNEFIDYNNYDYDEVEKLMQFNYNYNNHHHYIC